MIADTRQAQVQPNGMENEALDPMSQETQPPPRKKVWFHVDMDGLGAIYRGHGHPPLEGRDDFYLSAVENSLAFFAAQKIRATYFVIARDLDDPDKRAAIQSLVAAGHRVASHSMTHAYLNRISGAEKRKEIVASRRKIEDALGVPCLGFRAPGYSLDYESLEILREAGYRYDSTIFPNYAFRRRLGLERLFPEPSLLFPENQFFEIPLPAVGPWLPPFHPCYAFVLPQLYYRRCLAAFARRHNYLTYLFHLTDFASTQPLRQSLKLDIFTNNLCLRGQKLPFLEKLLEPVRREFSFTTTEDFLAAWPASAPDLNPRTILGISTTHETGACIVRDSRTLSAINEERITRRKFDNRYPPVESIREAIAISGIDPKEIDAVAVAGLHWKDLLPQMLDSLRRDVTDFHAWNDYFPHFCRMLYRIFYFWRATQYGRVRRFLEREYGVSPKMFFVEHHEAHAASCYRTGEHRDALVVTADGVGDEICMTVSRAKGSTIRRLESFFYPHSFGQFYTACTQVLGFKGGRHEGKITGLAGYGKLNPELLRKVEQTLFTSGGFRLHKRYYAEGFIRPRMRDLRDLLRGKLDALSVDYRNYKMPLKRLVAGYPREDVACVFQHLLERELVRLVRRHAEEARPLHVSLAGGVFANVKLNAAMSRQIGAESVYIFPAMGDGGLAVGAALTIHAAAPAPIPHVFFGPEYTEAEILDALAGHPELRSTRPQDMARAVAHELAAKKIVARFDGRMEFGPRALGNRSILYHCADPSVNAWLNKQLRRTEFMPFAPIAMWEHAAEYFDVREGEKRPCEFMTLVVPCTEKMKRICPAAVHVDQTARPQLLRRETNPGMYDILEAYKELTGIPVVINTSFNMHEEPIVRTPEDAISAFRQSQLDFLVLGPFLVWEKNPPQCAGEPLEINQHELARKEAIPR